MPFWMDPIVDLFRPKLLGFEKVEVHSFLLANLLFIPSWFCIDGNAYTSSKYRSWLAVIIVPNKVYHLIRQILIMIGISYLNPFCCNVILLLSGKYCWEIYKARYCWDRALSSICAQNRALNDQPTASFCLLVSWKNSEFSQLTTYVALSHRVSILLFIGHFLRFTWWYENHLRVFLLT